MGGDTFRMRRRPRKPAHTGWIELHLNAAQAGCGNEHNMKHRFDGWSWQLLAVMVLLTGSLFADSSTATLSPGRGTTVNGKAVYYSVLVRSGDRVQTTTEIGKITAGDLELEMAPNTLIFFGEQLILDCGSVVVRSGVANVSNGPTAARFSVGETAHAISTFCGALVPDSPGSVWSERKRGRSPRFSLNGGPGPAARSGVLNVDFRVANSSYWTVNGAMLGSSFAAANLTQNCLHSGACSFVPHAFRSSAAMYGAGLPAAAGVSYLTYYLKRKHYRLWFVPAALVTAGNIVVSVHAAHYSH